ncbi:hypothetical protein V3468_02895 [Flavobacterium oreochromis]|uniref:hypothetical protein n=1 Tax=Flavobacterium oreochromis TaxID=2906078 RepID=UPI00385EA0B2
MAQRVEALEKIINPNSVTLVNKQDPNEKVILAYDGEFTSKKVTTTETTEVIGTSEGL